MQYAGADYWKYANETILTFAMIETQQALDNLDAILKTRGLDAIYVGPSDLGLSLGFQPMADPKEPKVMEAIKYIVDTAKKHKIPAGIHCGAPAWAREMIALGYQLVTLQNDNTLLQGAARAAIARDARGGAAPAQKPARVVAYTREPPAIHHQHGAVAIVRGARGEEHRRAAHVLGLAPAAGRNA